MTGRIGKNKNFVCPACLTKVQINNWSLDRPPKCSYCSIPLVRMKKDQEVKDEH